MESIQQQALNACNYLSENYDSILLEINQDMSFSLEEQEQVDTKTQWTIHQLKSYKPNQITTPIHYTHQQLLDIQDKTQLLLHSLRGFLDNFQMKQLDSLNTVNQVTINSQQEPNTFKTLLQSLDKWNSCQIENLKR